MTTEHPTLEFSGALWALRGSHLSVTRVGLSACRTAAAMQCRVPSYFQPALGHLLIHLLCIIQETETPYSSRQARRHSQVKEGRLSRPLHASGLAFSTDRSVFTLQRAGMGSLRASAGNRVAHSSPSRCKVDPKSQRSRYVVDLTLVPCLRGNLNFILQTITGLPLIPPSEHRCPITLQSFSKCQPWCKFLGMPFRSL